MSMSMPTQMRVHALRAVMLVVVVVWMCVNKRGRQGAHLQRHG